MRGKGAASDLEDLMAFHLKASGLPTPEREHGFHPTRLWRFDFAWPEQCVALEVEGGVRSNGRHTRASGFEADCEKYNEAGLLGWTVFRATGPMVRSGQALQVIERALGDR